MITIRYRGRLGRAALAAALSCAPLLAGAAPAAVTLEQARLAAVARAAALSQSEASLRSLGDAKRAALADLLPSVSAGASYSASGTEAGSLTTGPALTLTATQTLFSGLAKVAALSGAGKAVENGEAALRSARLAVIAQSDTYFLAALKAQRTLETANKDLKAAEENLQTAKAKNEAGALSKNDFLSVQSTWATKKTTAVQAQYAALSTAKQLSNYIGSDAAPAPLDDAAIEDLAALVGKAAQDDPDAFVAALYAKSRSKNPDIRQKELAVEIAGLSETEKRAAFFPTLSASASLYKYGGDLASSTNKLGSFTLSASVPLFPLFGTAATVAEAKESGKIAASALKDQEDEVRLAFYTDTLAVLSALGQLGSADAALAYAEENYRVVSEKFKLSAAAGSDLSTAEATLVSAQAQSISSRFDLYTSLTALIRLSGAETEQEFRSAVQR